jgi:hypothetical protein
MYSPCWFFLMPGALLVLLGLLGYSIGMPGMAIGGVTFDVHTRLFASLDILCGYQSILFVMFTKAFAIGEGLMPEDQRLTLFFATVKIELGLLIASAVLLIGLVLLLVAVNQWRSLYWVAISWGVDRLDILMERVESPLILSGKMSLKLKRGLCGVDQC